MDKLRIIGGNTLHGTVRIDGAKNAALPILAASILAESRSTIRNVPPLSDVYAMLAILESLG
ncbi:MAG: UDP-N-acetylglucosamine 1-carboxyvinyltransferase, partial [bacterium]|nr:UDP-N-acetylglucosamine 1-carboxyvinyltransferase [bacterium]